MDNKESISNSTPNNQKATGWEDVAEMADKQTLFEQASKEGRAKMLSLGKQYPRSGFEMTFMGFQTRCHEKTAECVNTVVERVSKLAEDNDPEINVIRYCLRAGIHGGKWTNDSIGKFGTGEFIFETLGSRSNPENIGRLQLIMRTIPSSDHARYETMRVDARRIEDVVIKGRSFIHDNAPEAYKLITAMVDYYDSKNDPELFEQKRKELDEMLQELRTKYKAGYKERHEDFIFDLGNYDKPARSYIGSALNTNNEASDAVYNGDKGDETAIDVLRRLQKNMMPIPLNAPKTKIPELNEAFEKLGQIPINEQTGEMQIELKDLSNILSAINNHLVEKQGKRTLYPSTITAIAYIDKLSATVLKNLPKKTWQEIAFDPTFKEILRFSQLTMSKEYNSKDFETFYSNFIKKAGIAFEEDGINDETVSEAFKIIQFQTLKNAQAVAASFSHEQGQEYLASAVWSGNLTHELIGLPEKY
ncbi:MAG: hypothetical protein Q4A70_01230 [Candidatus Saccharibacteria bacterium]|nr:hypothetical protein [Candidatus Saccharibacteria bacterium]